MTFPMTDPASRMDPPPEPPPHDRDDPPPLLPDDLLAYARKAAAAANRLTPDVGAGVPGHAADALAYMRATREALQARHLAEEPLPPDERAATAHVIGRLRRDLETVGLAHAGAERQRDDLAAFLQRLADEVDALHTPGTDALTGRIRRHLADVLSPDPAEAAPDRAG